MKKAVIIPGVFAFAILNCKAQPNGGFENWHTEYSYEIPDNWQTMNMLSLTIPANPISAFKATGVDKHSGNYALMLKTIFVGNNPFPGTISDTSGVIFTGKINTSPFVLKYGFPYTGRPEKLEFYYKYAPVGSDEALARITLRKWNGSGNDTIAYSSIPITAGAAYTLVQLPLNYFSAALPDSAVIVFASSRAGYLARVNSTLCIDDVALTGWVGIEEQNVYAGKIKVFPNPARDEVTIYAQIKEADNIQIFDASGRSSGIYKMQNYNAGVNTRLFSEGTCIYSIRDKKNNILTSGKFNVIK